MKLTIDPITVNGQTTETVELRIVGYTAADAQLNIYYGYYNLFDELIDGGEGNLFINNTYIDTTIDTAIATALESQVGAVTSWVLSMLSLYTSRMKIEYVQGGETLHTRVDLSISDSISGDIMTEIFALLGVVSAISAPIQLTTYYATQSGATASEETALKTFVQELIDGDVYMDMVAVYPFVGSSLAGKYLNLLDPYDLDEAFRLSVTTGAPTDYAKGIVLANSHGDVMDAHISMPWVSGQPYFGAGSYLQNTPTGVVYGDTSSYFTHTYTGSDGKCYPDIGYISSGFAVSAGRKGHWNVQRIDVDYVEVRNEGVLIGTDAQHLIAIQDATIKLAVGYTAVDAQLSFFYVHRELTSTQQTALDTAIQNLMTSLGRNVA